MADHQYVRVAQDDSISRASGAMCYAIHCNNRRNNITKQQGITFHKFPNKVKNKDQYLEWFRNCRREKEPGPYSLICSTHFEERLLDRSGQIVRLRAGAVPTLFSIPDRLQRKPPQRPTNVAAAAAADSATPTTSEELNENALDQTIANVTTDHGYAFDSSAAKSRVDQLQLRLEVAEKDKRNAVRREKRAKTKCADLLQELEEKNLLTAELQDRLTMYKDIPLSLFSKPATAYTDEQRSFSLTLHLYSPKAYEFLRTKLPLPSPRTLRRWLEGVDDQPGLNMSMVNALIKLKDKQPDKYTHICFMIDGMSIRKQLVFNQRHQRMEGYVDLGSGPQEDGREASEALVFMITGLKSSWKAPVAYFLTNTLTAATQKELVVHTLSLLAEHGFVVHCLTLDGHASNLSMCRLLGADLSSRETFRPFFTIPNTQQQVFVLLDPCHMVKLIRNLLHAYGEVKSPDGIIRWSYISMLEQLQSKAGWRLGNKLTNRHVCFQQNKMKVAFATQTLSNSVADALQSLKDLGMPEYADCGATVLFIKRIDRLFDLLNSRSVFGKGYKQPIRSTSMQAIGPFLSDTKTYLFSLTTMEGMPLWCSSRSVCIRGFLTGIHAIQGMVDHLIASNIQDYICFYRFSQDHLELFFNAVRRSGGWNNNPNIVQFRSAFRKLISRCGAESDVGRTGNVTAQEEIYMIQTDDVDSVDPFVDNLPDNLSTAAGNSIVYISGYIVRKVLPSIACDTCRVALVSTTQSVKYKHLQILLEVKNNGGLVRPSDGVVSILLVADRYLRCSNKPTYVQCCHYVLNNLNSNDVLNLGTHITDTSDGITNHYTAMIRSIVLRFYNLKQHHTAKVNTLKLQGPSVRHSNTKSVLFRGQ